MALSAIVYASHATPGLSAGHLEELIQRAAAHNLIAGVTGFLIFDGDRFLQYIEGPDDGIPVIYSRILNSQSHSDLIELARRRISQRRMPYWPMRWTLTNKVQFNNVAFSDWTNLSRHVGEARSVKTGLDRLAELAAPFLA